MCISTMVQPSFATVGRRLGSSVPAETSLMMSAPPAMAAEATEARYVSIEMAVPANAGWVHERICLMAGRMRERSTEGNTWGAWGRVDWPPMSMMVAPE